ncbi:MAG: hypothetical protein KBT30_01965, partial [Clostridiales bacterium]|nr:hypothetical protein [Candidatus Apopatousia equi]
MEVSKQIGNRYIFRCGEDVYEYNISNNKKYSNEEFMKMVKFSFTSDSYYGEPCTMYNDPDGGLVMSPREKHEDERFLDSIRIILEHTKNEKKKTLLNSILNKCLIIDKEPTFKKSNKDDKDLDLSDVKEFG